MRTCLLAAWLVACTSTPADDVDSDPAETDTDAVDTDDHTDPPEPSCELGTGELELQPLDEGADLTVIIGPQGGWHVLGSLRCEGIVPGDAEDPRDPDNPRLRWVLENEDREVIAGYEDLPRPMNRDGEAALIGEFIIVWTRTYAEAIDRDATMRVDLRDAAGVEISLSRGVHLVAQAGWEPPDTESP